MGIEPIELRRLLGNFATGVAVVTALTPEGERCGVTINSFNSVSMSPELVLFSLDRGLRSLPLFMAAERYCVNLLSSEQQDVSARFAARGGDKWAGTAWRPCGNGAPLIDGVLAHMECERHEVVEAGDHLIFLCRVRDFSIDAAGSPLVFYRGGYHALLPAGSRAAPAGHGPRPQ